MEACDFCTGKDYIFEPETNGDHPLKCPKCSNRREVIEPAERAALEMARDFQFERAERAERQIKELSAKIAKIQQAVESLSALVGEKC